MIRHPDILDQVLRAQARAHEPEARPALTTHMKKVAAQAHGMTLQRELMMELVARFVADPARERAHAEVVQFIYRMAEVHGNGRDSASTT